MTISNPEQQLHAFKLKWEFANELPSFEAVFMLQALRDQPAHTYHSARRLAFDWLIAVLLVVDVTLAKLCSIDGEEAAAA
eukprot:188151-Pleurochrysis_carterae.AAC.1